MIRAHHLALALVLPLLSGTALAQDEDEDFGEGDYRYNFDERKVEGGIDAGYAFLFGTSTQAFFPGPTVTPYMDFSFGDGNSLDFQVTLGYHGLNEDNAQYYFFRSPVMSDSDAYGELVYAIPHLTFRYESDLTPSLSKRGRVFYWAGMGMGPAFVSVGATLENAGQLGEVSYEHGETLETFLAVIPAAGLRFRLGEFFFFNTSVRFNALVQFGQPDVVEESDMESFRTIEGSAGISYEFGG